MKPYGTFLLFYFSLIFFNLHSQKQWSEDFDDSELSRPVLWEGDTTEFAVNQELSLQMQATQPSPLYISCRSEIIENAEWEFFLSLTFSPSASNYAEIFICSDHSDPSQAVNAYFIRIGGISGSSDDVSLYLRKDGLDTEIIDGIDSLAGGSQVEMNIKVKRDSNHLWELMLDTSLQGNYFSQGSAIDSNIRLSQYFSLFCQFTSSRADRFYFDDINVQGDSFKDRTAIFCRSVELVDSNSLLLQLSEVPSPQSALDLTNYKLLGQHSNLLRSQYLPTDSTVLQLDFNTTFPKAQQLILQVDSLEDQSGNQMQRDSLTFIYFPSDTANFRELQISELMPDPSPSEGLPEAEYIELFNSSNKFIDLQGWSISDPGRTAILGHYILYPYQYLILCEPQDSAQFSVYGSVLSVPNLPTLNNSGDFIELRNSNRALVDQINYQLSWYDDETKASGGWSLEMVNPYLNCNGAFNYRASTASNGGSPGIRNSVFDSLPDTDPPKLLKHEFIFSGQIRLFFNEAIDSLRFSSSNVSVSDSNLILNVALENYKTEAVVDLLYQLDSGTAAVLSINELWDCDGNRSDSIVLELVLPASPDYRSVQINEFLAISSQDPQLQNAEYIELHNPTEKIYDLKDWEIGDAASQTNLPAYFLRPDSYVLLYPASERAEFREIENGVGLSVFPALNNVTDRIILLDPGGEIIDELEYNENWPRSAEHDQGGISFEQINPSLSCSGKYNFYSSGATKGGTPGEHNSIFAPYRDSLQPHLVEAHFVQADSLLFSFNEGIFELDYQDIMIDPKHFSVSDVNLYPPAFDELGLKIHPPADTGTIYYLKLYDLVDCQKNKSDSIQLSVQLPFTAVFGELILNEILFDPYPNGVDFIELYNLSDKTLSINGLYLSNKAFLSEAIQLDLQGQLFKPGDYWVLTEDADKVKSFYPNSEPANYHELELPSFNNDEGEVYLWNESGQLIEAFTYNENMHFELLQSKEGVSLERIDPKGKAIPGNFFSAAESEGFATPGRKNSQYSTFVGLGKVALRKNSFSPDQDGYDDLLFLDYDYGEPGYVGSVQIIDLQGRRIRQILNNQLLAKEGSISWDGLDDRNGRVAIGTYLLIFEVFHPSGKTDLRKFPLILAGRLD